MGNASMAGALPEGMLSMLRTMDIISAKYENIHKISVKAGFVSAFKAIGQEASGTALAMGRVEYGIGQARKEQEAFNQEVSKSASAVDKLFLNIADNIKNIDYKKALKKAMNISDRLSGSETRLGLAIEAEAGQDTGQAVKELQSKIFASANRSGMNYLDMADSVADLSLNTSGIFGSGDEVVQFAENMSKQLLAAGTKVTDIRSTASQITEALSSGVLRGEELDTVFGTAPNIVQTIADYIGVGTDAIRAMAAEGGISAEIVKNAMLSATDSINAEFAAVPVTFAQIWELFRNYAGQALAPVWQKLNALANSPAFMKLAMNAGRAFSVLADILAEVVAYALLGAEWISDNWLAVESVFLALAGAAGVYAAALGIQTAVTWAADIAAKGFFKTLLANPLMWIALIIGAIVAAIYQWVQSVGGLRAAWLLCMDNILTTWEYAKLGFVTGIYSILDKLDLMKLGFAYLEIAVAGILGDMKVKALSILESMINGAIDLINQFIGYANRIPGVSIDTIAHVSFAADAAVENEAGKKIRMDELNRMVRETVMKMEERKENLGNMAAEAELERSKRRQEIAKEQAKSSATERYSLEIGDYGRNLEPIAADTGSIAEHTETITDSLEIADEDIKYLRDIAERDAINRFTTAEIKVDMGGVNNHINSDMDIDGFVQGLCGTLEESLAIMAEGEN